MSIETVLPYLTDSINNVLLSLPKEILNKLTELRIRKNKPLILVFSDKSLFITENGKLMNHNTQFTYKVMEDEFDLIYKRLSNFSVQTHIDDLINGFITVDGGNRVGIASTAVLKDGQIASVKNVTSLNIRIAREVKDCARQIMNVLYINSLPSIIVASPPAGGKTTFLRDFSRLLSSGFNNQYRKVAIIDERSEIAFKSGGKIISDVGCNADILSSFPKAKGIEIALRTLSPDFIICDEISDINEAKAVRQGFLSGVKFAVSVHASTKQEILDKPVIRNLISLGEFDFVVLLNDYTNDFEIMEVSELRSEIDRNRINKYSLGYNGHQYGAET